MVKDFDQDGHKDRYYDEGNGKPWKKYVKDQLSGQNQGDANKYREQQDGGYPHMTLSRDKEWGNSGQTSETRGYNIPMTAGRTGNFSGNNQEKQYALARGSRTSGFEKNPDIGRYTPMTDVRAMRPAHVEGNSQKKLFEGTEQGGSRTSGFEKNPDMGRYTPMTDVRAMRQAQVEGNCQKKLFEGTEQGVQRKPNLKRFVCPNQIRSINKALTSVSEKTPIRKNSSPENLTDGDSSGSAAREKNICTDKSYSPLIASDSEKTPIQKNLSPENLTGGDSSGTTARGKSFTPTLTDLENSVHYDCRLDKILRVAIDYALPEELR